MMKLLSLTWPATFLAVVCAAQGPPAPNPVASPDLNPHTVQAPAVPNTPFESSSTPPGTVTPAKPADGTVDRNPVPVPSGAAPETVAGKEGETTKAKRSYVIGALDILDIRVWNDPKLSGIFDVRPDGILSMNLIGEIRADGLTVPQLHDVIVAKLSDLINAPEVNVQLARSNSKRYFIFGEVGRSGEFPLVADTTILDALSNTGGFREFANPKKIYVLRGSKKLPFNYKDVSHGKHMEQNILLENGDRIFVP